MADPPPATDFDMVHSRLVVEHIGTEAIPRMVDCLKPGGWLLLEDYDTSSSVAWPEVPEFQRVSDAIFGFMAANGMDPLMGRKLPGELIGLGLEEVDGLGQVNMIRGGGEKTDFYEFTIRALKDVLVEQGLVSAEDCDRALELLQDPSAASLSPVLMAVWGRKPVG
jgi:SAM-dependent methyltransferase